MLIVIGHLFIVVGSFRVSLFTDLRGVHRIWGLQCTMHCAPYTPCTQCTIHCVPYAPCTYALCTHLRTERWLAAPHAIPKSKFHAITLLQIRPTYHKSVKGSLSSLVHRVHGTQCMGCMVHIWEVHDARKLKSARLGLTCVGSHHSQLIPEANS